MKKNILALCDTEQEYASHFMDYLHRPAVMESFPFEVRLFTDRKSMERFGKGGEAAFLLIAQSLYEEREKWEADRILVLAEDMAGPPDVPWIGKYQPMEAVVRRIIELSVQTGMLPPASGPGRTGDVKLIGVYSPVGRCLQTTFSFTLGQLLARKHKVLYLNFECFSGLGHLLRREFGTDLSDLIYFIHNKDGRFPYRLEGMAQKMNGMDFIPPVFSCMDLGQVEKEEWLALLDELEGCGMYEYILLDLTESIRGLFDLLKRCSRIYTIVKEDGFAQAKQEHYEELLRCMELEDILEKTRKCRLPVFRALPPDLASLTHGELAGVVGKLIGEDLEDRGRGRRNGRKEEGISRDPGKLSEGTAGDNRFFPGDAG